MGFVLQTLGRADNQHLRSQADPHLLKHSPAVMRWHHADHDRCPTHRFLIVAGRGHGFRKVVPRQKKIIAVSLIDRVANFRLVRPQPYAMRPFAPQGDGQRRAPRPRANDRDFAHLLPIGSEVRHAPAGGEYSR